MKFFKDTKEVISVIWLVVTFFLFVAVVLSQRLVAAFFEKALVESVPQAWDYAWNTFWGNLNVARVIAAGISALVALPIAKLVLKARRAVKGGAKKS